MLILNWREPRTHMERHLGPVTHKGQEWAPKNWVSHHWSSALRRTAHHRAPCQQQTTSLHNVPPSQSAHYVSAVPTCVQTSQLTPYQLKVGTGWHSYWMPTAWQEWRNAPILPIWWNMPSQTPSSSLRPICTAKCTTLEFMPPGYSTPLRKDRDKWGGGVLIAVKDCYTITALNLPENDAEIVWGEVLLRGNKRLCLGAYYRTPSGDASSQQEALAESLKEVQKITRNRHDTTITLGGDFNFKDIDWNTESVPPGSYKSTASQNLLDTLQNHHLSQMQKEPTRQDSVLDLYITNIPSLVKTITTIPSISDHDGAMLVDSDIVPAYSKKKPRKTFVFSKANWSKMKEDPSTFVTSFLEALPETSVDENWEKIKGHLTSSMAKHIPSRTTSRKQHQPWITHGMKERTRKKHRMYRKARKSGNPDHMSAFWDYKKQSAKEMKKAKVRYVNKRVLGELEDGNTKPFYRYIKSLRMDNIGLPPLKSTNTLVTSALDKATILLNEFSSVFTCEDTTFIPWLSPAQYKIGEVVAQEPGVRKLLLRLKPHKASSPDQIPNRVLKELAWELSPALTALYNQSLTSGCIPKDWSRALISPVYKKGYVHEASNYRPVSLTSVACKILEHIVCKHLLDHLERHNLLTTLQHGFRKAHSCESQLLITLDDLCATFDKMTQTDVGIMDFSWAFDTVPYERLLGKLAHYSIQGRTNSWICAFLTGRSMSVVVDGESSEPTPFLSGVPQGTVLGPLLFLIYINDMPSQVSKGTWIRLLADDCPMNRQIQNVNDQTILQQDLDYLHNWAVCWGMTFNPCKCYIMHITRGRRLDKFYQIWGTILSTVTQAKYLGITIRDDLHWHQQTNLVAKKANITLHMISRNLRYCPRKTRSLAYCTLVRPKLQYCVSLWDPYQQQDIDALERINRRAVRVVSNKTWRERGVSPTALLKDLGWDPQSDCRWQHRLSLMYRITHGLVAVPPTRLEKPFWNTRGHSFRYKTIGTTCDIVKHSYYPRTIPEWNNLSDSIVNAPSLDSFKQRLSKP